jgi:hypothetical protein
MPICKNRKCRKPFEKKAANQLYCQNCSYWSRYSDGRVMKGLAEALPRLKAAADASGNPKTWRAGEYSQEELRRLIPSMQ